MGASEGDVKQSVGEKIYVKVQSMGHDDEAASKITGILIDQGLSEISDMIQTEQTLEAKISEANQLLQSSQ